MNLVDENDFIAYFAELILRIHQNKPLLSSHLAAPLIQRQRIFLQLFVVLFRDDTSGDNLRLRNILVVTLIGFGSRRDDRMREFFVLLHALGHRLTAKRSFAGLVLAPCMSRQISPHDHFYLEWFATQPHGHHRIGSSHLPVRDNVRRSIQKLSGNLVQHLPLVRNTLWKNHVECRNTVTDHHHQQLVVDIVYIAHFAVIHTLLSGKFEIGFYQSIFHFCNTFSVYTIIGYSSSIMTLQKTVQAESCNKFI